MAAKTKTTQQTETVEGIKTNFIRAIMERRERAIQEEKALRYIDKCERKRIAKAKRKAKIKEIIVLTSLWTLLGLALVYKLSGVIINNAEDHYVYSMQGELQGNSVVLENEHHHNVDETYANYTSKAKSVTVVLDNNGTKNVKDDKILNIY